MTENANTANALAVTDGFDIAAQDPTASPIRGVNYKFKDGGYFAFAEEIDVHDQAYVVLDRRVGWQKLAKDTPPEYLMQQPGEPRPPQPHVEEKDWPLNLNGEPEHPWKLTHYLYLLNEKTGEIATFWSNTAGGNIAIGQLSDQVAFMRGMKPGAMPVVALQSRDMPTQYGGTKPRPHFQILRWKMRDATASQQLLPPEEQLRTVEAPTLSQQMGGDKVPWNNDPVIDAPKAPSPPVQSKPAAVQKSLTNKKGHQKITGAHR
jgi:hypothetical protein